MVHGDLSEAELFVEFAGPGVVGGDLQRDTVGVFLSGPLLTRLKEGMAYTRAPVIRGDLDVLDGGPGLRVEGWGALTQLAGEEAYNLPARLRDEEAGVGARGEVG